MCLESKYQVMNLLYNRRIPDHHYNSTTTVKTMDNVRGHFAAFVAVFLINRSL